MTDETLKLINLAQSGDKDATQQLIQENMGLIWSIVKKFMGRGYEADDLFQIGAMGLLKCIRKFDLSFNVKFSTYAVPMIMGEIKRFIRDDGLIKVSRPLKEIATKAKHAKSRLIAQTGKSPTLSELANELGVEMEDLIMALESGNEVESLYAVIYQGDNSPVYLIDKLNQQTRDENPIDNIALKQIIGQLDYKERQIIVMRYFKDKTQAEVAATIGVSQVQVSRIEKKILKAMREKLG